jgi:hypothetical protein
MLPTLFRIPLPSGYGILWYYVVLAAVAAGFNALTTRFGGPAAQGRDREPSPEAKQAV